MTDPEFAGVTHREQRVLFTDSEAEQEWVAYKRMGGVIMLFRFKCDTLETMCEQTITEVAQLPDVVTKLPFLLRKRNHEDTTDASKSRFNDSIFASMVLD